LIIQSKIIPPPFLSGYETFLVDGSVVISVDYFKQFVAGLRNFVGGRVTPYEILLDRARREAILRMKEEAKASGADVILNVKYEMCSIYKGRRNSIGSVEALAYGTAFLPTKTMPGEPLILDISNPQPSEGINTSKTHPLKEFFLLSGGVFAVIAVVIVVLSFLADTLSQYIPFEVERTLVRTMNIDTPASNTGQVPDYLQSLANDLRQKMDLPEDMDITVSVINSDTVNAFATLGGNIVFFTGLLDVIPNENILSMVMAHEIAHIKFRHPLRALGRGVVVGVAVATMSGVAGNDIVAKLIGDTSLLTTLNFSRSQENAADKLALEALVKQYGHANGSIQLFELFSQQQGESSGKIPEFFTTHPLNQDRIVAIQKVCPTK